MFAQITLPEEETAWNRGPGGEVSSTARITPPIVETLAVTFTVSYGQIHSMKSMIIPLLKEELVNL